MRIIAYTNLYLPDCMAGAQTMMRDLLAPLHGAGHDVQVLIHNPSRTFVPYRWDGIPVVPHNGNRRQALPILSGADLIITTLEATDRGAAIGELFNVPVVQIIHNDRWGTDERLRMRCDLAVFNSQWIATAMRRHYKGPSIIVHPPINPDDYRTTPGEAVTLVNLWADKGAEVFYHCAKALPDVPFIGVTGGYGLQVVEDHPNVTILPQTADMREVYFRTRLILMPSRYESWGRVGVEAAVSGIPTIAHPTPGLTESLGEAGTFVDRDTPDVWVETIKRLLGRRRWLDAHLAALKRAEQLEHARVRQLAAWTDSVALLAIRQGG